MGKNMLQTTTRPRRGRPSPEEVEVRSALVLEAARAEFLVKGYRATTMSAIAARAKVSKRSLYSWHGDKAALFESCVIEQAHQLRLEVDDSLGLEEALTKLSLSIIRFVSTEYALSIGVIIAREQNEFAELHAVAERGQSLMMTPIAALLVRHGVSGNASSRLAYLFLAILLSNTQRRIAGNLPLPTEQEINLEVADCVSLFLRGVTNWQ